MIKTIYLVKKNPNKPNSEDNWLMMSIAEFNEFVKTPEAKGRYFADLGSHEYSDIWYVAECDKETALKWRKELNEVFSAFVKMYNRFRQNEKVLLDETITQLQNLKTKITMGNSQVAEIDGEIASLSEQNSMYSKLHTKENYRIFNASFF